MAAPAPLPQPALNARRFGARCVPALTDDALFAATGVRIAFTGREGGVSEGPYGSLNLGSHVGDDAAAVGLNRQRLLAALGGAGMPLVVPNQVHGDVAVAVPSADAASLAAVRAKAADGADALVVGAAGVAALLCFADCTPVVAVSPTGRFAVAHAGWRGVMNGVAARAVRLLAQVDGAAGAAEERAHAAGYNVYIGPHICAGCFEVGEEVAAAFAERFGAACVPRPRHVDMAGALAVGLGEAGVARSRIVRAGACTKCAPDAYYSYRASGGTCGRHGAIAFRKA